MTCGTCQLPIRQIGNFNRWVHEADGSDDFDPPHSAAPAGTPEPSTPPAQPDSWESRIRAQHPEMSADAVGRAARGAAVMFGAVQPPDPTHGRIDRDIQAEVDEMNPTSLGQRVAIENTLQARRDAVNRPAPPAQPVHTPRAAAGGHPGTLDGAPSLGDQMAEAFRRQREHAAVSHQVERTGWTRRQWVADAERLMNDLDGSVMDLVNGHVMALLAELAEVSGEADQLGDLRAKLAAADTEVDELRGLVDPAAGPLIRAVHGWRAAWTSARRDENADRLDMALIDAVDAYDRPTTGGDVSSTANNIQAEANAARVIHDRPGVGRVVPLRRPGSA